MLDQIPFFILVPMSPRPFSFALDAGHLSDDPDLFESLHQVLGKSGYPERGTLKALAESTGTLFRTLVLLSDKARVGFSDSGVDAKAELRYAIEHATQAGHVWTPLLDAWYTSREWEDPRWAWKSTGFYDEDERGAALPTPTEQAEGLSPWIAAQTEPEEIGRLLRFSARVVHFVVARHARCLTDEQVQALLGEHGTAGAEHLAKNAALTDIQWYHLCQTVRRDMGGESEGRIRNAAGVLHARATQHGLPPEFLFEIANDPPWNGEEEVAYILSNDRGTTIEMLRVAVQRRRMTGRALGLLARSPVADETIWQEVVSPVHKAQDRSDALTAALRHSNPPQALIRYLLAQPTELVPVAARELAARALGPMGTTPDVVALAEAILDRWDCSGVREELARSGLAAQSDVLTTVLLRSRSAGVLGPMLLEVEASEFRRVFARLVTASPESALDALEERIGEPLGLRRTDLAPILAHGGEVARRAMLLLPRIERSGQPSTGQSRLAL